MTFEKELIRHIQSGYYIKCIYSADIERVVYMLGVNGYQFGKLSAIDEKNRREINETLNLFLRKNDVLYIYLRKESANKIVNWSDSCSGRRISVSELEQALNPNYR